MVTFLKKAGADLLTIAGIVLGFAPLAKAAVPQLAGAIDKGVSELTLMKSLIIGIEAVGQSTTPTMSGADKLKAATPQIAQVLLMSDMMIGHTIKDQALFQNGAEQIASGMANVLNSLEAQ